MIMVLVGCVTILAMVVVAFGIGFLLAQREWHVPRDDHPWFDMPRRPGPSDLKFRDPGKVRTGGFAPSLVAQRERI